MGQSGYRSQEIGFYVGRPTEIHLQAGQLGHRSQQVGRQRQTLNVDGQSLQTGQPHQIPCRHNGYGHRQSQKVVSGGGLL